MDAQDEWEDVDDGSQTEEQQDAVGQDEEEELEIALHAEAEDGPSKGKKKPGRSTVSSDERKYAMLVHRSNALCLLCRCMVLDQLADDLETQAALLSLLEPSLVQYLNPQHEAQRLINCLQPVLSWFKAHWATIPVPPLPDDPETSPTLQQQVLAARNGQEGEIETLTVLFVALMRASGMLARVVRLLDGAPLTPWKKPPGPKQLQSKARGSKGGQPAAARGKKQLQDVSKDGSPLVAATGKAGAGKRARGGGTAKAAGGKRSANQDVAAQEGGDAEDGPPSKRSKADEEFETQLRMALLATQAAHDAGKRAAVSSTAAQATEAQVQGEAGGSKAGPSRPTRSRVSQLAGGGASGGGAGRGKSGPNIISHTPEYPACWAEVWCGSAEYGRWVCVDLLAGHIDKPDQVAGAIAAAGGSAAASGYIVAVEHGGVVDVTSRYLTNSLWVRKLRDVQWWSDTVDKLQRLPVRAAPAAATQHAGPAHVASNAAQGQLAPGAAAGGSAPRLVGGSGGRGGVSKVGGSSKGAFKADSAALLRQQRETAELENKAKAGMVDLPTSIDGFQNHPLYVLKRHITKYQALQPGTAALGLHKGEPYYARNALSELHTADRWRREGWQVRADELDKPVKITKKRKQPVLGGGGGGGRGFRSSIAAAYAATLEPVPTPAAAAGQNSQQPVAAAGAAAGQGSEQQQQDDAQQQQGGAQQGNQTPGNRRGSRGGSGSGGGDAGGEAGGDTLLSDELPGEEPQTLLYGKWQTEPFLPRAENGTVPRNERGNVEVPPFAAALPTGCAHLPYPGLIPICKFLDVDYAPALIGFELRAGRSVPKFEGVVICQEHAQAVMAAFIERETAKEEAARAKHVQEMRTAWLQLLQALLMRAQLADSYGDNATAGKKEGKGKARGKKQQQEAAAQAGEESKVSQVKQRLLREDAVRAEAQTDVHQGMEGVEAEEI